MKVNDEKLIELYQSYKLTDDYQSVFTKENPLVSVCIATWNRAELLCTRAILSVLNQTYKNIEIIVIGDCCTDNTEEEIEKLNDKRIFFYNRKKRKKYNIDKTRVNGGDAWNIAGIYPVNLALIKAKGDFVTHLDDDDEMLPNKIEDLVKLAQENKYDYICHGFEHENYISHTNWGTKNFIPGPTKWYSKEQVGNGEFGKVTTGSQFYHKFFKKVLWDIDCVKRRFPGDWDRYTRVLKFNPNIFYHNQILLRHYLEHQNVKKLIEEDDMDKAKVDIRIPIARPSLPNKEKLLTVIDEMYSTRLLSNFGKYSNLLEKRVKILFKTDYTYKTVSSCDIGLILAIKIFDFPAGSEIIVPSFTFQSTINAIKWNNLEPIFVDIDKDTLNIDINKIQALITDKTVAILATHVFGNPVDRSIETVAENNNLKLIFDAAHAFGSKINGVSVSGYGDVGVFSFSGTKIISGGEGGLAYFKNKRLAEKFDYLRNYGFKEDYNTKYLGLNGKLSELNAAIIYLQLDNLSENLRKRKEIFDLYNSILVKEYRFQVVDSNNVSTYKDIPVSIDSQYRNFVVDFLTKNGIQVKKYFLPQHITSFYHDDKREGLPVTQDTYSRIVCLPVFNEMGVEDVRFVANKVNEAIFEARK